MVELDDESNDDILETDRIENRRHDDKLQADMATQDEILAYLKKTRKLVRDSDSRQVALRERCDNMERATNKVERGLYGDVENNQPGLIETNKAIQKSVDAMGRKFLIAMGGGGVMVFLIVNFGQFFRVAIP